MVSCRFVTPSENLSDLDSFFEASEIETFSVFENSDLGFSERVDENGFPIAKFFDVEVLVDNDDNAIFLEKILKKKFKGLINNFEAFKLKDEDWVSLYVKDLKPIVCDRFYFYNDMIKFKPDDSSIMPIKLNSALAFGSGHHQTTQGCILNARYLSDHGFVPENILDMGCGTGILGICALKIWPQAHLIGIDIDSEAVKVTKENYELNGIHAEAIVDSNLRNIDGKFNLIFSNILKQPLIDLCPGFVEVLNVGGYVITSGFITSQESDVVQCYEAFGLEIESRIQKEDWLSIAFKKK